MNFEGNALAARQDCCNLCNMTIHEFDTLSPEKLQKTLMECCASRSWINKMMALVPFEDFIELIESAEEQWFRCSREDWREGISGNEEIAAIVSRQEEENGLASNQMTDETFERLESDSRKYKEKFGYSFVVYSIGKSPSEIISILNKRMNNDPVKEINISAEEQNKIMKKKLRDLFFVKG